MGPKKKLPPGRPRKTAKLVGSKTPNLEANSNATSSLSSKKVNAIMGRKNRLEGLLSSQETVKKPKPNKQFEVDDDGFMFKRSQEKKVSTPESKLRDSLAQLTDDDEDTDETEEYIYQGRARGTKRRKLSSPIKPRVQLEGKAQYGNNYNDDDHDDDYDENNDDSYVEQVSHHKIQLDGEKKKVRASNRGKRISSIGNGFVGVPHADVPVENYYKLLDTSLPEPHRMKQLLIWCFKKKLEQEEKTARTITNPEEKSVVYIAKVIKEEVLKDLIEGQVDISWYNKPEEENPIHLGVTTVANPLNVANETNINLYKDKLKKLLSERGEWEKVYQKNKNKVDGLQVKFNQDIDSLTENYDPMYEAAIHGDIIKNIKKAQNDVEDRSSNIQQNIDALSDITYKLDKGQEIADKIRQEQFNEKISIMVNDYMTFKNKQLPKTDNDTNDQSQKNTKNNINNNDLQGLWIATTRPPTTKELLRGIARLDAKSG